MDLRFSGLITIVYRNKHFCKPPMIEKMTHYKLANEVTAWGSGAVKAAYSAPASSAGAAVRFTAPRSGTSPTSTVEGSGNAAGSSAGNMGSGISGGVVVLALYSTNEKMLAVQSKSLSLTAGERGDAEFSINYSKYPDATQGKVFRADTQSYTPITLSWQGA